MLARAPQSAPAREALPEAVHPPRLPEHNTSGEHKICFNGVAGIREDIRRPSAGKNECRSCVGEVSEPLN